MGLIDDSQQPTNAAPTPAATPETTSTDLSGGVYNPATPVTTPVTAPTQTATDPVQAAQQAADAASSTAKSQSYTAQVSKPADFSARTITGNETVAGQLNNLLNENSAYMQSATNRGLGMANSRGMLNSSMAAGAAQRAAIDAGLPIATADAATYANAAQLAQQGNQELGLTGYKGKIDSALSKEKFGYDSALSTQGYYQSMVIDAANNAAAMGRLDELGKLDLERAKAGDAAAMERLTTQGGIDMTKIKEQGKLDMERSAQGDTAAMERLKTQAGYDIERAAQGDTAAMARLKEQAGYDLDRAAQGDKAAMERLKTQGAIDAERAANGDKSAMERLKEQARSDAERAANNDTSAMERLKAQGELDAKRAASGDTAAKERLGLQIAGDLERAKQGDNAAMLRVTTQIAGDLERARAGDVAAMERLEAQGDNEIGRVERTAALEELANAPAQIGADGRIIPGTGGYKTQAATALKAMDIQADVDKMSYESAKSFVSAIGPLNQQYLTEVTKIQTIPDSQMSPEEKMTAITNLKAYTKASILTMSKLYGTDVSWSGDTSIGESPDIQTTAEVQAPIIAKGIADGIADGTLPQGTTMLAPEGYKYNPTTGWYEKQGASVRYDPITGDKFSNPGGNNPNVFTGMINQ